MRIESVSMQQALPVERNQIYQATSRRIAAHRATDDADSRRIAVHRATDNADSRRIAAHRISNDAVYDTDQNIDSLLIHEAAADLPDAFNNKPLMSITQAQDYHETFQQDVHHLNGLQDNFHEDVRDVNGFRGNFQQDVHHLNGLQDNFEEDARNLARAQTQFDEQGRSGNNAAESNLDLLA